MSRQRYNHRSPPPPRLTLDDAMLIWRARDLYRLERAGYGCLGLLWLMLMVGAVLKGRWDGVGVLLLLPVLVCWGVPWLLRFVWRAMRRWWRQLALAVVLLGLLTGCEESARAMARLSGFQGDPFPGPCAAASLQVGYCVPVKQQVSKP